MDVFFLGNYIRVDRTYLEAKYFRYWGRIVNPLLSMYSCNGFPPFSVLLKSVSLFHSYIARSRLSMKVPYFEIGVGVNKNFLNPSRILEYPVHEHFALFVLLMECCLSS